MPDKDYYETLGGSVVIPDSESSTAITITAVDDGWGNEYDEKKANLGTGETAPVGTFKEDKSPYGVYDMAGNVMEWVDAWYLPYERSEAENKDFGEQYRVLRGGSSAVGHYMMNKIFSRGPNRHYYLPGGAGNDGGFRCASSTEKK